VKAWDFENKSLAGTLEPDDPDVDLSIPKAAENFGGCGMAPAPDDPNGTPLSQIRATSWTGLDQITAAKSYLHAAPDDGRQPRAYVVKGDVLGVLGTAPGWLHVEYVPPTNLTKSVKGWIAASEAAPLTAP
jgi:hypothetical protein